MNNIFISLNLQNPVLTLIMAKEEYDGKKIQYN